MSRNELPSSSPLTVVRLQAGLQQALYDWQQPAAGSSPLHSLRLFYKALHHNHGNIQRATNQVVVQALAQLALDHREHAEVLQRRFLDNEKIEYAANRLNLSLASFHRKRNEGMPLLAKTVLRMEIAERSEYQVRLEGRLEQNSSTKLFGKEEQLNTLASLLIAPEAPWLIVITGIGGIGKTTVADAVVRRLAEEGAFDDIGWVTARETIFHAGTLTPIPRPTLTAQALVEALAAQLGVAHPGEPTSEETLAALVQRLKTTPHLIVIDNLETMLDLATLLPTLRRLANPSKILLTTRDSLAQEADLYHLVVPQLSATDALAFVRQEATMRNIPQVLAASDDELRPLVTIVGGNPLALRLVTGQLRVHPLGAVLADLMAARGKHAQALYAFIYQRAWALLGATARAVLLAMPLLSEQGSKFELLAATCDVAEVDLREALEQLVTRNLVDVHGDLHERRYTIHSLTRTFLQEQVLHWQQPSNG